jgi:DNA-binding NarL/FixJ family response regulator
MRKTITVLCVDDHPVVRDGLALNIDAQPDMKVVGTAATGEEAIALFRSHKPAVTLMDLRMPRMSGLDAIRVIRKEDPNARIIILTTYDGDEDIVRGLQAGAVTYVLKTTFSDSIVSIIREVHDGKAPIPDDVAGRLAARQHQPHLSPREVQVLQLVGTGMRTKEAAAAMGITEETAHGYLKSSFSKLGVNDRTAAVRIASRRGIIHLDE